METPRKRPPPFAPDAHVLRLRAAGWTLERIAEGAQASVRQVYRWSSGDSRPMPIYAALLARLSASLPKSAE